jgi:predicted nucleic acid-binding protein
VIVLDASAAIEWLLQTPTGTRVEARLLSEPIDLRAPHLLDVEVVQVFRRSVASGRLTAARAEEALLTLNLLAVTRHPPDLFLWRIWELRHNLTAYDAAYVALAEALDAPLVTCDGRTASARDHRARVEVIR